MLDMALLIMSKYNCTFAGGPRRTKVTSDAPAHIVIFPLIRELVHLSKKSQIDVVLPQSEGWFAQFLLIFTIVYSKSREIHLFL